MSTFDGYFETPSKIAARKARIQATDPDRQPVTKILPPMTRAQWEAQPLAFKFFHPWKVARKPLEYKVV